jgi:hypothetical protein
MTDYVTGGDPGNTGIGMKAERGTVNGFPYAQ